MAKRIIRGYGTVPAKCPTCHGSQMMIEDDDDPETYHIVCWCGAHGRVRKDDPDVVELLTTEGERR